MVCVPFRLKSVRRGIMTVRRIMLEICGEKCDYNDDDYYINDDDVDDKDNDDDEDNYNVICVLNVSCK